MLITALTAFAVSAAVCWLIVWTAPKHIAFTGDVPDGQPQKLHAAPVPRIGGVGVFAGLVVAGMVVSVIQASAAAYYWLAMAVLSPAFLGGISEDFSGRVGVSTRLWMTVLAAAAAFVWAGARLYRSDIDWLDWAFGYWWVSLAGTLFAVAGVAHAVNIIDGQNGLAAGVALMSLIGLGLASNNVGDMDLAVLSFSAAGACVGFLLFNFPSGQIFLGDGGAYFLGAMIAVLSAVLVGRNPEVSPWFPLMLIVYPVWETLFSMIRRVLWQRRPMGKPDRRHLHSLIYRRLLGPSGAVRSDRELDRVNAGTATTVWIMHGALVGIGAIFQTSSPVLAVGAYGYIILYCLAYLGLSRS